MCIGLGVARRGPGSAADSGGAPPCVACQYCLVLLSSWDPHGVVPLLQPLCTCVPYPPLPPPRQALGDAALARGIKEVDRCQADDLRQAGGLLPGLDPQLQQAPLADLLLEELRQVGGGWVGGWWGGGGPAMCAHACIQGAERRHQAACRCPRGECPMHMPTTCQPCPMHKPRTVLLHPTRLRCLCTSPAPPLRAAVGG